MYSIYLDSTFDIVVGIVNSKNEFEGYKHLKNAKGSTVIHNEVYQMLKDKKLSFADVSGLIQISGPGSYTGMRVSEGITQIFDWQNFKVNSFYHFEIPRILGEESGIWIANAFKGELFVYQWKNEEIKIELLKTSTFLEKFNQGQKIYSAFAMDIDVPLILTSELIRENGQKVFDYVLEHDLKRELYYYRTIEEEFKRPEKL